MLKIMNEYVLEHLHVLNNVDTGIVLLPRSGEIIWSNATFMRWFPNCLNEGTSHSILDILGSDFRVRRGQIVNPLNDVDENTISTGEIRIPDGRYFEISVRPYLNADLHAELGEDVYFVNLRDLTQVYNQVDSFMKLFQTCESLMNLNSRNMNMMTREDQLRFLSAGIVVACKQLLKCEVMETRIYRRETQSLELFAHYGITDEAVQRNVYLHPTQFGIIGYVASTKQTYRCNDTSQDSHYLVGGKDSKSSLTAPIVFRGNLVGIVNVESPQTYAFSDLDVRRMELFVQYLAIALNTLDLLEVTNRYATQMSVEKIHASIAKPSKIIAESASRLSELVSSSDVQSNIYLHKILRQIFSIRRIVSGVGETLQPRTGEDVTVVSELNGKQVLLLSSDDDVIKSASRIFDAYGSNLCIMRSGNDALRVVKLALSVGDPHYLIVVDISKIPDFDLRTKFFLELGKLYGKKHPPLMLIQWMMSYDGDHVLTNTRSIYPKSRYVGYDPNSHEIVEDMLLKQVPVVVEESAAAELDPESEEMQRLMATYSK